MVTAGGLTTSFVVQVIDYGGSGGTFYTDLPIGSHAVDVPEPSTWSLAIAGLAGLGLVFRRRRALAFA